MGKRNGLATPNSNFVNGKVSEETRTVHQASSTTLGPGKQLTTFLLTLNCGLSSGTGFCFILTLSAKAHEANDDLFLSFLSKTFSLSFQAISSFKRLSLVLKC